MTASNTADEVVDDDLVELYERAPCGYLSVTPDGVIIRANLTFGRWSGRTVRELLGQRFASLLAVGSQIFYETRCLPTLLLAGKEDNMTPFNPAPSGCGFSTIAKVIPGAELHVLDYCGHYLVLEQPEEATQLIVDFVSR